MIKVFAREIPNDGVAEKELNRFLVSHRIVSVRTQWVTSGETPYEVFTVEYTGIAKTGGPRSVAAEGEMDATERVPPNRPDYRKLLTQDQFVRYCKMRDERKKIADGEAVKAFVVFTNEQLASIAKMENPSLAALKKIDGIGEARVEKYGARILECLLTQGRRVAEVRYMDDILVFGSHEELKRIMRDVPKFLASELALILKPTGGLHRTERGVDFLGTRVLPFRVSSQQLEQQHRARQKQQLLGLSCCLLPRSSKANGTHLNRPLSRSSCGALGTTRPTTATNTPCPCGAGRRRTRRSASLPERHAGRLPEQVAVGAESGADELKLVFDNPVDQHKVGFNMAVAIPRIVAGERMVVKRRRKWLLGAEEVDDFRDLSQVLAASNCKFEVSRELLLENAREHGGQSSIANAAFSISSVLLNGPYDGSRPAMSRSRTARVSALGYSFASSSSVRVSPRVMPCGKPRCSRVYMRRTFMPVDVVIPRREKRASARRLISGLTRKAIVDVAIANAPVCLTDVYSLAQLPNGCKRCNALAARCTTPPSRTGCQPVQENLKGTKR